MTPDYWREFLALATIHLLAVVAPGPDFAITIRQSLRFGRRAGIATAIGIGAGISVHVIYTLLGVGALIHATPWLLRAAELIGGAYLLYLGSSFIHHAGKQTTGLALVADGGGTTHLGHCFVMGFLTNASNPKAMLFFLAIFTSLVSATTPLSLKALYGTWMCLVNATWFVIVSLAFTGPRVRERFLRAGHWLERSVGLMLIALAIGLLWKIVKMTFAG